MPPTVWVCAPASSSASGTKLASNSATNASIAASDSEASAITPSSPPTGITSPAEPILRRRSPAAVPPDHPAARNPAPAGPDPPPQEPGRRALHGARYLLGLALAQLVAGAALGALLDEPRQHAPLGHREAPLRHPQLRDHACATAPVVSRIAAAIASGVGT